MNSNGQNHTPLRQGSFRQVDQRGYVIRTEAVIFPGRKRQSIAAYPSYCIRMREIDDRDARPISQLGVGPMAEQAHQVSPNCNFGIDRQFHEYIVRHFIGKFPIAQSFFHIHHRVGCGGRSFALLILRPIRSTSISFFRLCIWSIAFV